MLLTVGPLAAKELVHPETRRTAEEGEKSPENCQIWTEAQKRALSRAKTSSEVDFRARMGPSPGEGFSEGKEMGLEVSKIERKWREKRPRAPEQPVRMDFALEIHFIFP